MSKLPVEVLDLEKLVKEQIPDWETYPESKKFRIRCPHCEEGKSPALSVLRNMRVGICFRCEKLFVRDSTNSDIELVMDFLFKESPSHGIHGIDPSILDVYDSVKGQENEFLKARNPFIEDWSYYKIRQGHNFVLTPYFMMGKLVYYQKRFIEPRGFLNPDIEAPLYLPDDSDWDMEYPLVIVEGPFDAIAVDCVKKKLNLKINIAGLGGKSLSDYRISLIEALGRSKSIVFLDDSDLSYKLLKTLKGKKVEVPSDGMDPEEWLRALGIEEFYKQKLEPYIKYDLFQVYKKKQKEEELDFKVSLNL